jgi:hypothetical protein
MDSDITKANRSMHLNLALDVLYGCKWSCGGCHVNTTGQNGLIAGDDTKILKLTDDFVVNNFQPSILIVGPTDIFTAKNTLDVMQTETFATLVKPFLRIGFNTTFLEIDDKVIDAINAVCGDKEVEFKIVVEAKQFTSDKYLNIVKDNMISARSKIKCANFVIHPQFNLFDYRTTRLDTVLQNYEGLNQRSYDFFGQGIDYVLSFSRSDTLDRDNKLSMLKWIQDMFNEHVYVDNAQTIHFDAGNVTDFQEHIYTYRNGNFYYAPKVYDEYVCFDDEMKIPTVDWSAEEFTKFDRQILLDQYQNINNKECATCPYAPMCVNRGILFFMDYMGTTECIMPKHAFDVINKSIPV